MYTTLNNLATLAISCQNVVYVVAVVYVVPGAG
jgi:hypothetical protein